MNKAIAVLIGGAYAGSVHATEAAALAALGWDAEWDATTRAAARAGAVPGRVARVDKGHVLVLTATGTERAKLGGELVDVATGDWVLLHGGVIATVLPRRSAFVRGDSIEGRARKRQVVAANVDLVFVVQSLTNGPNARRLERELVLAYASGATPVVVLTKADLVPDDGLEPACETARAAAPDVDVVVTSVVTGIGLEHLRTLARDHRTVALIGASGVGKSTLVNALVGSERQSTGDVREHDQRGRHTTTSRELVPIPGGGLLIDTPGLRAVSLWDADDGFTRVFGDIETLAARCKFTNCSHNTESGCAVRAAIADGSLDAARFEHYLRLDAELDEQYRQ